MAIKYRGIEDVLLDRGIISQDHITRINASNGNSNKKTYEVLLEQSVIRTEDVLRAAEQFYGVGSVNLEEQEISQSVVRLISEAMAKANAVFPLRQDENRIFVAMNDPNNIVLIDELRFSTNLKVVPVFAIRSQIMKTIELSYSRKFAEDALSEYMSAHVNEAIDEKDESQEDVTNAPVVRLVRSIIEQSVALGTSDIHIEPYEQIIRVRFRIDGALQKVMDVEKAAQSAILTRIKILAGMDIAEKRIPLDGRIETSVGGKNIDLRVSTLPTVYGEKVVMRLLDRSKFMVSKESLGFTPENLELYNKIVRATNGIILITGPTGSGKTTTLYAALREMNKMSHNIVTVEDPVEYMLDGINQVQVNNKAGMTFANGLRAILRQDPDVIMIGEIRDSETAQIAVRAAVTGHIVLSTMHTNDTASTISRLMDMGVEGYLVSSTVVGVVAQRLMRKICPKCKRKVQLTPLEVELLKIDPDTEVYKGDGCQECNNTGYKGRVGIHEIMLINKEMRTMIDERRTIEEIKDFSIKSGMSSLWDNGLKLVLSGATSVEELIKIAYSAD